MNEEIRVYADLTSVQEIEKKYPGVNFNYWIESQSKQLSRLTQEQLEKRGFNKGRKEVFCDIVKDSVLFIQADYKEEDSKPKEEYIYEEEFSLIWEKDLRNFEIKEQDWKIKPLIPNKSIGVWTGKRGEFKTWLVSQALCEIGAGLKFLGEYETTPCNILYLDKENGLSIMKKRIAMIKTGLGIEKDLPIGFICFSSIKLDKTTGYFAIKKMIEENNINLLVIDTYRRAISFNENDAGEVSHLFVDLLRPLVDKNDLSIILIHHNRKGNGEASDEMDELRGSSDLTNYADFILKNERHKNKLVLKQLKCRNAPEIEPIQISINTDETSFIKFTSEGVYEKKTKESQAVELLTIWISKREVKSFKTKDAQDYAFSQGIAKNKFFDALSTLESQGVISKTLRGYYEIL